MKFRYGKHDWKTLERGQENCYLLTNGLGGFSSSTMIHSVSRNDHALLMACVKAPNHRYNMVHRISEELIFEEKRIFLSSQQFEDGSVEDGYQYLSGFSFEDIPCWEYQVCGVEILKQIAVAQGENTVAVHYQVNNRSRRDCSLTLRPCFQFVRKGGDLSEQQVFSVKADRIESNNQVLYYQTNGGVESIEPIWEEYHYAYDAWDGRKEKGKAFSSHIVRCFIAAGENAELELIYSMKPIKKHAKAIIEEAVHHRKDLDKKAGFQNPIARVLAKSASQFISKRESTKGDTILAGYPFFEDWGRDTMIALPGCVLSTGQYETAKSILRTFMMNEQKGLMPNLFPEGSNEPAYNTADAALLFINCVYLYYQRTQDANFLKETYPVMDRIISWYQKGTDYGIHMDEDGLLMAGKDFDQVTWMDVRVGEILPTPRHGKPVEINAYWYNALKVMEEISAILGKEDRYGRVAVQVKHSFQKNFWMEEKKCLKDVISHTKADEQIRCNQIWAVSLPHIMLEKEQALHVVETVFEKLYTPYGLRTLDPSDPEFSPFYGGEQLKRDLAYHQGTVWVFPLGAYYLAYLRVHDHSTEAVETVKRQLEYMESAMREGCVGQLPEIYDGLCPTSSKGCFAQAWSVGEILRVYEALEHA